MTSRNRSVRFRIASILLVPMASLTAFWLFAVYTAAVNVRRSATDIPWAADRMDVGAVARLVLVGALGLIAIQLSIVVAIRVARPLIREMRGLSAGTRDFANRRLPLIADRLRRGEATDGDFEAPRYSFTTTETVELLESFVTARRAAVQATVQEAAVRRGISDVFLNLARRNQALLHRQLGLLDTMERQATEPEALDNLFLLDHLATRMRRHAEGLVILSGATPGRGWRNPVPLVDVVRSAVGEVEDYARVTVSPVAPVALAGPAVADVIHLLAELVENATLFSPPHTGVRVSGQLVGNGLAVEIEDRGLGMGHEELTVANELLESSPEFDLSDSTRLGFFVVSRLARRHGIKVSLRPSPYDGTTAIVLVPWSLVIQDDDAGRPEEADCISGAEPQWKPEEVPERFAVEANEPSVPEHADADEPDSAPAWAAMRTGPRHAAAPISAGLDPAPAPVHSDIPAFEPAWEYGPDDRPDAGDPGLDLPRRTRQTSLAPQLRDGPAAGEPDDGSYSDRGPEQTRTTMASIQQGWLRGRSEYEREQGDDARYAGSPVRSREEEGS